MTDFEPVGGMTSADMDRIRALILPESLPAAKPCERCDRVFCVCPKEAA